MPSIGVFFEVEGPDTLPGDALSVVGSLPELGKWNFDARQGSNLSTNAFMYPLWTTLHPVSIAYDEGEVGSEELKFQYKYTIFKSSTGVVKRWEDDIKDRMVSVPLKADTLFLVTDSQFNQMSTPTVCETTMEEMKKRWASFVPDWITLPQMKECMGDFADTFMLTPHVPSLHGFAIEEEFGALSPLRPVDLQTASPAKQTPPELQSPSVSSMTHVPESPESNEAKNDRELRDVSVSTDCSQLLDRSEYEAALQEIDALRMESQVLRQGRASTETHDLSTECSQHDYKDEYEASRKEVCALRTENQSLREAQASRDVRDVSTECFQHDYKDEYDEASRKEIDALRSENDSLREAHVARDVKDVSTECSQHDYKNEYEAARKEIDMLRAENQAFQEAKVERELRDASTECSQPDWEAEYKAALEEINALRTQITVLREVKVEGDMRDVSTDCSQQGLEDEYEAALEEVDALRTENDELREENKVLRERWEELLGMQNSEAHTAPASAGSSMTTETTTISAPPTPLSLPTGFRFAPGELLQVLARLRREVDSRAAHYSNENSQGLRRSQTLPTPQRSAPAARTERALLAPAVSAEAP
eukprot:CAMPEP_0170338512 /NCGR_PEP_ID=MMETSP0116_2-20130129/70303_1 /TAXON_ID=400756 /ORGANISM="Durinskia baltica, Strain CSIRO CS-38" /LENGTH=594 /DNA_ID=CAMNT_0010591909 /DNA_START=59 /DNA_END=1840 /DNA_ORIENTATION=+